MEYLILDNYLKKIQRPKGIIYKSQYVLFIGTLVFGVGAIISIVDQHVVSMSAILCICFELLCCIFMVYNAERIGVVKSEDGLDKMKERCSYIRSWLEEIGYKDQKQIQQLCGRCEVEYKRQQKAEENSKKNVEKMMSILVIPAIFLIMQIVLESEGDLINIIQIVVIVTGVVAASYLLILAIVEQLQSLVYSYQHKMRWLINDLHIVLDMSDV